MSVDPVTGGEAHLPPDELRTLFLFADLTEDQLAWVSEHGDVVAAAAGERIVGEGDPAACFYVLISGKIAMSKLVGDDPVESTRTDQRGVYFGATRFFVDDDTAHVNFATVTAITDCALLALPAQEFAREFARWYPMAVHLLDGMLMGNARSRSQIAERERLLALGKLSAGLAHELNNPAAAAGRAADMLRDKVAGMRSKLAMIADGRIAGAQLHKLVMAQDEFVKKVRHAPSLSPLETSDREDEVGDWLDDHGIDGGWELAPTFVAGGLGVEDLEAVRTNACDDTVIEGAIRWLSYTVETESLMREIIDATSRISALVDATKQYSQLDRAPYQDIDIHDGLEATLVMFGRKFAGAAGSTDVVREYDRSLPLVPAYPAELNQVWTNLIDNAVDAMAGAGTLTVRTALDGDYVRVDIADTGPGIPEEMRGKIFDPFFTTKPVGHGTGLGLDVSYRVVVSRHHGDLTVTSGPEGTTFHTRLPRTSR